MVILEWFLLYVCVSFCVCVINSSLSQFKRTSRRLKCPSLLINNTTSWALDFCRSTFLLFFFHCEIYCNTKSSTPIPKATINFMRLIQGQHRNVPASVARVMGECTQQYLQLKIHTQTNNQWTRRFDSLKHATAQHNANKIVYSIVILQKSNCRHKFRFTT